MLNKDRLCRIIVASLLCLLCSCAATKVRTEHDSSVDFSSLNSYRFLPQPEYTDPRLNDQVMLNRIKDRINAELKSKGRAEAATDVDFIVDFRVRVSSRGNVSLLTDGGPWAVSDAAFGDTEMGAHLTEFDQGSLVIKILNPTEDKVFWAGLAEKEVDLDAAQQQDFSGVDRTVSKLMDKFPPQ